MMLVSLIPFTDILKLVIAEAKKVKDFKPLIKDLASTIERLLPIFQEIDELQERLDPGNKEIIFLTKLMLSAKKMVHKCSRVRVYNLVKINSYTKKIKKISKDFLEFCQIDLQLIRHRDQLRSRSQGNDEEGKRKQVQVDDDEQLSIAIRESQNMEEELSSREAEELQKAIQESVSLRSQQEKQVAKRKLQEDEQMANSLLLYNQREDEEQRILWESFKKDNGKRKKLDQEDEQVAVALQESLNTDEELSMRQAIQESISLHQREEQVAKRRIKKIKHANGSTSLGKVEEEQRILWESLKEKGKTKQVEEDELVAIALQESLNSTEEPSMRHQQVAKRVTNNGSSSSTRALLDEDDMQWVLWESLKKRQRKAI
ncbi:hypothetical protein N665_0989s0007 [Sinapis alba]|nr:hypothetical protein N665_0989s0007 [Sinapis alba]